MSHTVYLRNGLSFRPMDKNSLNINDPLPIGTYTVKFNQLENYYYLDQVADFNNKTKIYGNTRPRAERIFTTFKDRPNSTGVLLAGDKGSGKTQLAKLISSMAAEDGVLTILVNEPHAGESFNQFMQSIQQPSVVIFDEFEKVYNEERGLQDAILTILDGVYPSKKLFIATINSKHRISDFMVNRPGRFFYKYEYGRLEQDIIIEYCNDMLQDKSYLDKIINFSSITAVFSFDILKAIVEECNRYGGEFSEITAPLNISVDMWSDMWKIDMSTFKFKTNNKNKDKIPENMFISEGRALRIYEPQFVAFYIDEDGEEEEYVHIPLTFSDAKDYNLKDGTITYETDKVSFSARIHKTKVDSFNLHDLL